MATDDFFRARLDGMVDPRHPLAVLARRMPWAQIEASLAPLFARKARSGKLMADADLFGTTAYVAAGGVSRAGRPRLPIRLMVSLLYLKHAFNESDESVCERWSENVVWQLFSGMEYYQSKLPCDATQIGRFRRVLGEAGVEQLLKTTIETALAIKAVKTAEFERVIVDSTVQEKAIAHPTDSRLLEVAREKIARLAQRAGLKLKTTIETALAIKAVKPAEFERVIVDSTVQEKAIAHPTDSRLLEVAREKIARLAQRAGLKLKSTHEREGHTLRRRAGGYAHAKQFKRLRQVLRRQRTILGVLLREVRRKMTALSQAAQAQLDVWLQRAERIHAQRPSDKNKLYALHAPEVECIGKGKARKPYEFGVKVSLAVTHKSGLMVGARSFPGNPFDGHTLEQQLEQTTALLQDIGVAPKVAVVDLGYRGVDQEIAPVELIHRGKYRSLSQEQRRWLKRRQAIEPLIGHTKQDHGMQRCWLKGSEGDALHAVLCAAGFNIRWLMRALLRQLSASGLKHVFLALMALCAKQLSGLAAGLRAPAAPPHGPSIRIATPLPLRRCSNDLAAVA